ncbi:putative G-patch domain protein [Xylariaceae sp. FL1019]|nr:putative G-patch domain protein [Xylariaceae sp. FL1019]
MASDEEDDYMNMTFGEEPPQAVETSLQRRQRLKREGEIKGRVKSKAELASEEREARDAALATSMLEGAQAKKSKGLAMMAKMGFKGGALGNKENQDAITEPLRPEMRDDRGGIGLDTDKKRKFQEAVGDAQKKVKIDQDEFRDRVRKERESTRLEHQVYGAMKVCERMDEESPKAEVAEDEAPKKKRTASTRPLNSIPVVWRGLIRKREEDERDRRMKHDVQQGATRLPTYEDDSEDEEDKKAMGKTQDMYSMVESLDEEDPELDEFKALEPEERLRRLVQHLRDEYHYCFWCKFEYPDNTMEGCPGLTEEDHD